MNKEKATSRIVTVLLPENFIEDLDTLVEAGFYKSRAEAIRFAVRDLLLEKGFVPSRRSGNLK